MGRRLAIGTDAALTGVLVAALIVLWSQRGMHPDLASIAIGLAGPSSAGAALILISLCVPPLIESEKLSRPQTYALPAIHTALTLFATRMMLTGATPVASVHEKLLPATLWLYPPAILSLFLLSWAALEVTHRRQISSVS